MSHLCSQSAARRDQRAPIKEPTVTAAPCCSSARASATILAPKLSKVAQAGLLDQRERHIAEFTHALLVTRKREQHAVETGARQREQRVDDLLLRSHHGK